MLLWIIDIINIILNIEHLCVYIFNICLCLITDVKWMGLKGCEN